MREGVGKRAGRTASYIGLYVPPPCKFALVGLAKPASWQWGFCKLLEEIGP